MDECESSESNAEGGLAQETIQSGVHLRVKDGTLGVHVRCETWEVFGRASNLSSMPCKLILRIELLRNTELFLEDRGAPSCSSKAFRRLF